MKKFFVLFLLSSVVNGGVFVKYKIKVISHNEERAIILFKGSKRKIYFKDILREDSRKIVSSVGKVIEIGLNETKLD
jgi:hypothetical protein